MLFVIHTCEQIQLQSLASASQILASSNISVKYRPNCYLFSNAAKLFRRHQQRTHGLLQALVLTIYHSLTCELFPVRTRRSSSRLDIIFVFVVIATSAVVDATSRTSANASDQRRVNRFTGRRGGRRPRRTVVEVWIVVSQLAADVLEIALVVVVG